MKSFQLQQLLSNFGPDFPTSRSFQLHVSQKFDPGKALDSARKREGNLKYNSSRRDEEAIELAKEAMNLLSNKTSGPISSPSKSSVGRGRTGRGRDGKQLKKTSSTKLKTGPSPYLQKRSKSAPVKKVKF